MSCYSLKKTDERSSLLWWWPEEVHEDVDDVQVDGKGCKDVFLWRDWVLVVPPDHHLNIKMVEACKVFKSKPECHTPSRPRRLEPQELPTPCEESWLILDKIFQVRIWRTCFEGERWRRAQRAWRRQGRKAAFRPSSWNPPSSAGQCQRKDLKNTGKYSEQNKTLKIHKSRWPLYPLTIFQPGRQRWWERRRWQWWFLPRWSLRPCRTSCSPVFRKGGKM